MDHAMSDTARRFISQVLLVFLAMLLIISGIWGSPTSLAYRHLFLDSMMIVCLMRKPFSQSHKRLANGVDFCLAALVLWIAVYVLYDINGYQMRVGSLTRMDVVTGTIYMGILLEPVDMEKYDFVRLPYKEKWGVLVHKNSELASKKQVKPEELPGLPLINTKRSIVQKEIAGWSKDYYEKLTFIATYNLLTNAVSLVEHGLGSVITIKGAFYNHSGRQVKFLPFSPELTTGTVLVWKKNQILSRAFRTFLAHIYDSLEQRRR